MLLRFRTFRSLSIWCLNEKATFSKPDESDSYYIGGSSTIFDPTAGEASILAAKRPISGAALPWPF
jgi:hypothetical protein